MFSLSFIFFYRAGSGYPNGYPVLENSRGGFLLPSSRFVITYCDQSFPSPWHCLSTPHTPHPIRYCPLVHSPPGDADGHRSAPAICQSFTSADPTCYSVIWFKPNGCTMYCEFRFTDLSFIFLCLNLSVHFEVLLLSVTL